MKWGLLLALALTAPATLAAQEVRSPEKIDILVDPTPSARSADLRDCEARRDAAKISGEIIVCGQIDSNSQHRLNSREDARNRYAQETMNRGGPPTPDPCGPNCGIFKGAPSVSGICGIGLNPCPPPPAYMIDFSTLPEAPPGSDADRIARGLPPLGNDDGKTAVSPSESASPAEEPSG